MELMYDESQEVRMVVIDWKGPQGSLLGAGNNLYLDLATWVCAHVKTYHLRSVLN